MTMSTDSSKTVLFAIRVHAAIKDYSMWGYSLSNELQILSRSTKEKAIFFETMITFIKLMIEAGLDKECIIKFAENYCQKYDLSEIQTDAIKVLIESFIEFDWSKQND